MLDTLDDKEEQELLTAVKTANDLVTGGLSPDAAVEKVARDRGFGPGKIRLIGHAYNTGEQLGQWRAGGNILDKLAEFSLCDPQKVIDAIYNGPTQAQKEAAERLPSEYSRPPTWLPDTRLEKAASLKIPAMPKPAPYKPDPLEALHRAYGVIDQTKQASEEARRQFSATADRVRAAVADVVGYFKQAGYNRLAFDAAETAARTYFGEPGTVLMDLVYQQARLKEKRASDKLVVLRNPIDLKSAPFTLIKRAIDEAEQYQRHKQQAMPKKAEADKAAQEQLLPFVKADSAQPQAESVLWSPAAKYLLSKQALIGVGTEIAAIAAGDILATKATHEAKKDNDPYGDAEELDEADAEVKKQVATAKRREKAGSLGAFGLGSAVGSSLGRTVSEMPKGKDQMVEDAWTDLEDPEHENELRRIKTHAMLNQLMTDPEDPISGHDPDKVLSAYNEISSSTPRLAEHVATLRPALRKRLEGHQEPFESKELLDIEKGLTETKRPTPTTNILSETPKSILG